MMKIRADQHKGQKNVETAITERTSLRIFLTGAGSTFGRLLIRHLTQAGHQVYGVTAGADEAGLVRQQGGLPLFIDTARAAELESNLRMAKADLIVHAAPQAANHLPLRSAAWDADGLVAQTQALVNAAARVAVKGFIHTSYAFVVGDHAGGVTDETTTPSTGDHPLLTAALRAEQIALSGSVPTCVLRLGYLYGPESEALNAVAAALRLGRPVASGDGLLNWLHMDDAVEAVRRTAESLPQRALFNVVDGQAASSAQFVATLARLLGVQQPGSLPRFAQRLLVGGTQLDLMALSAQCKADAIREALGWTPLYPNHAAGLEQTLLSWRVASA